MAKKTKTEKEYKVSLFLKGVNETIIGEGDTLNDAMAAVKLRELSKSLGVITLSHGEKSITKTLTAPKLNRMFNTTQNQEVKKLSALAFVKYIKSAL